MVNYSDEDSAKGYDENPDDSDSLTEKPSEISSTDSQVSIFILYIYILLLNPNNILYLAHQIKKPILKLRILKFKIVCGRLEQVLSVFLLLLCFFVCRFDSGFIVLELVVGSYVQDNLIPKICFYLCLYF